MVAQPWAGALPQRDPVADHRRWRRQQRLAGPAVETRTAEAGQRTRRRHRGQPPAARYQQVEQNRAPPFLLHQPELACPAPRHYRVIVELISATTSVIPYVSRDFRLTTPK